ncbi:MAG: hypothetical protein IIA87_04675 [Nanoarchaeota archaeon]|nr:hypothetical protein [Nanoarchaeota archaeon]
MTDIFNAKISCTKCDKEMKKIIVNKSGAELRAVECPKCKEQIIHPADMNCLEHYNHLKGKTYNVKLRLVGNSHTISIPKEIINFMHEQERTMDNMVRLCFEDMTRMSLRFGRFEEEF